MKIGLLLGLLSTGLITGCASTQALLSPNNNATPLSQILKMQPELKSELATVEIRQYFNRPESPSIAVVKVTQTNLLDDSIKSIRATYTFNLKGRQWVLGHTQQDRQCYRSKNPEVFQTARCP